MGQERAHQFAASFSLEQPRSCSSRAPSDTPEGPSTHLLSVLRRCASHGFSSWRGPSLRSPNSSSRCRHLRQAMISSWLTAAPSLQMRRTDSFACGRGEVVVGLPGWRDLPSAGAVGGDDGTTKSCRSWYRRMSSRSRPRCRCCGCCWSCCCRSFQTWTSASASRSHRCSNCTAGGRWLSGNLKGLLW